MELRASYCGELNSQSLNAIWLRQMLSSDFCVKKFNNYRMGSESIINSLTDSSNIER